MSNLTNSQKNSYPKVSDQYKTERFSNLVNVDESDSKHASILAQRLNIPLADLQLMGLDTDKNKAFLANFVNPEKNAKLAEFSNPIALFETVKVRKNGEIVEQSLYEVLGLDITKFPQKSFFENSSKFIDALLSDKNYTREQKNRLTLMMFALSKFDDKGKYFAKVLKVVLDQRYHRSSTYASSDSQSNPRGNNRDLLFSILGITEARLDNVVNDKTLDTVNESQAGLPQGSTQAVNLSLLMPQKKKEAVEVGNGKKAVVDLSKKIHPQDKVQIKTNPQVETKKTKEKLNIAEPYVVGKTDNDPNRKSEDAAFRSESAFGVLDGIGSGREYSGDFARDISNSLSKIDFTKLTKEQLQPQIDKAISNARIKMKNQIGNKKIEEKVLRNIGCTLAVTATLSDGKLYSITAGDSHVWSYDANGKKIFDSPIDSYENRLKNRKAEALRNGETQIAQEIQDIIDDTDAGHLAAITNSLSYTNEDRKVRIVQIPENSSYIITVSDGYDKLGINIPAMDKEIEKLMKDGKTATEIQKEVSLAWANEIKQAISNKKNPNSRGFGADDFSFVCAQVDSRITVKQQQKDLDVNQSQRSAALSSL